MRTFGVRCFSPISSAIIGSDAGFGHRASPSKGRPGAVQGEGSPAPSTQLLPPALTRSPSLQGTGHRAWEKGDGMKGRRLGGRQCWSHRGERRGSCCGRHQPTPTSRERVPTRHPERHLCPAAGLKASGKSLLTLFRGRVLSDTSPARLLLFLAQPGLQGRRQPVSAARVCSRGDGIAVLLGSFLFRISCIMAGNAPVL